METHLGLTELYQAMGNITGALEHYDQILKVIVLVRVLFERTTYNALL
jgi:hypothetical protein